MSRKFTRDVFSNGTLSEGVPYLQKVFEPKTLFRLLYERENVLNYSDFLSLIRIPG